MFLGETISFAVAISWTATALFAEVASKRLGSLPLNVLRMVFSLAMLALMLWFTTGTPYPRFTDGSTWTWLSLSGFVGYILGDYCLFQSYVLMNSRIGQLFMTLASPSAALAAWVLLGESMRPIAILGMLVTMTGIGMSILSRTEMESRRKLSLDLPLRGVLFGIGAGMGQGMGLVLSKVGMAHYAASIAAGGIQDMSTFTFPQALLPLPLSFVMPFASTMIRATIGLVGFSLVLGMNRKATHKLHQGLHDGKAIRYAFAAALFGPFLGVGLSLMATLYTNAGIAQTIMATTPVMIILPSWFLFHQRVSLKQIAGALISVLGVSLFFV